MNQTEPWYDKPNQEQCATEAPQTKFNQTSPSLSVKEGFRKALQEKLKATVVENQSLRERAVKLAKEAAELSIALANLDSDHRIGHVESFVADMTRLGIL